MIWIKWGRLVHTYWQRYLVDFCLCSWDNLWQNNSQQRQSLSRPMSVFNHPRGKGNPLKIPSSTILVPFYTTNYFHTGICSDLSLEISLSKRITDGKKKTQKPNSSFLAQGQSKVKQPRAELRHPRSKCFPKHFQMFLKASRWSFHN